MVKNLYLIISLLVIQSSGISQTDSLSIFNIDAGLLENANSVVRLDKRIVNIPDRRTIEIEETRIVTVLNKKGNSDLNAYVYYDELTRVRNLEAVVYDKLGKEIKDFSKRDFTDVAAVDGISLFTDSRVKYLDYTPIDYPYTVVFRYSATSKNTAFLPQFYANTGYLSSTEKSYLEINYLPDLGLRSKVFDPLEIIKTNESSGKFIYQVQNATALKAEPFSPGFQKIVAKAIFSLDFFHLEGVDGQATSWKDFGKWMDQNLLMGTREIPEKTKKDILSLVDGVADIEQRVKLIYEYMQNRTRYISVQVGIGGWKPMLASEVDDLGYGDCKALSNYTKALLEVADIPSYYTILYGDSDKRDIQKDFPSVQGNHAILAVPLESDFIWLECTSQTVPYGFIADFTDDRDVLVITPDGGEIVHTKIYEEKDNSQFLNGSYSVNKKGDINASLTLRSRGTQYDDRHYILKLTEDDKKKYYYNFWKYINTLSIENIQLFNDSQTAEIKEEISFTADSYATFAGDEMLLTLNALNRFTMLPNKNRNRIYDIEIDRGFQDIDEISIKIPEGMEVQNLPEDVTVSGEYGSYSYSIQKVSESELLYKRSFTFLEGSYSNGAYVAFRNFLKKVVRHDNQKIILTKIN